MQKQTKFKTFLVSNIVIFLLISIFQTPLCDNTYASIIPLEQDTTKILLKQEQKNIEQVEIKADSATIKWDAIEKAVKERQKNPN